MTTNRPKQSPRFSRALSATVALLLAASIGTLLISCAADEETVTPGTTTEPILDGKLDAEHLFAVGLCVGALQADGSCPPRGTPGTVRCTATLVAPNVVVTARHCVEGLFEPETDFCTQGRFLRTKISASMQVTIAPSVLDTGNRWYRVAATRTPAGTNACDDDLALLILREPVTGMATASIALDRDVARFPPQRVAMVGRGAIVQKYDVHTLAVIEFDDGHLVRREAENIPFVCASNTDGACRLTSYFYDPPVYVITAGVIGFGRATGPGDSGSGVYDQADFSGGNFRVIGVNTTGSLGADGNLNGSQAVRVDRHAAFIRAVLAEASDLGHFPIPLWAR